MSVDSRRGQGRRQPKLSVNTRPALRLSWDRLAHDFVMQIDVLIEAGLPLPADSQPGTAQAVPPNSDPRNGSGISDRHVAGDTPETQSLANSAIEQDPSRFTLNIGNKAACEATIRPQINALNEKITQLVADERREAVRKSR